MTMVVHFSSDITLCVYFYSEWLFNCVMMSFCVYTSTVLMALHFYSESNLGARFYSDDGSELIQLYHSVYHFCSYFVVIFYW